MPSKLVCMKYRLTDDKKIGGHDDSSHNCRWSVKLSKIDDLVLQQVDMMSS